MEGYYTVKEVVEKYIQGCQAKVQMPLKSLVVKAVMAVALENKCQKVFASVQMHGFLLLFPVVQAAYGNHRRGKSVAHRSMRIQEKCRPQRAMACSYQVPLWLQVAFFLSVHSKHLQKYQQK